MMSESTRGTGAALAAALVAAPQPLWACATCFGQSDAPMAQGMNMGIFTLLIVILSVLVGIAAFFVYIVRRAARVNGGRGQAMVASALSSPAGRELP